MADIVSDLTKLTLQHAAQIGGATWNKLKDSSEMYFKNYYNTIATIAEYLAKKQITKEYAYKHIVAAKSVLYHGFAYTTQLTLTAIQQFIDAVLNDLKGAINAALPIAVL